MATASGYVLLGGVAPSLVTESVSGADQPNGYLRLRLAEKRGWSAHDLAVSCFQPWPEGDYTTQRRLDILVAAVSTIDPTVDDPSHIAALYKLDDPERFTREVTGTDDAGNAIASADPFPFEMETADLGDRMETRVWRGYSIRYERPGASFIVNTIIDDVAIQSDVIPASGTEVRDLFVGIARDSNTGSRIRFRIFDDTEFDLKISMIEPMWIPKGTRARG